MVSERGLGVAKLGGGEGGGGVIVPVPVCLWSPAGIVLCLLSVGVAGARCAMVIARPIVIGRPPLAGDVPHGGAVTLKAVNVVSGKYVYLQDLLELSECVDQSYPVQWPVCPTPVRLCNWEGFLQSHPNQGFASYIRTGLSAGFCIGFDHGGPGWLPSANNHPSAWANAQVIREYIAEEVQLGRLMGPLKKVILPWVKTSPISLVPKAHQVDKWRMIVDLSYPRDHSVNSGISSEHSSITYAKLDDAVEIILKLEVGTQLVKLDLKSAYRIVSVHPQDHHLLVESWEGETYVDRALPFGLRSAPKIFSAVACRRDTSPAALLGWFPFLRGPQHG